MFLRRLAVVLAALVAVMLMVGWMEARFVFFPMAGEQETPEGIVSRWRALDVATDDGETLRAWWLEHPEAVADVIYFHGNGGNLSVWLPVLTGIQSQGMNVLAVDYRGYGLSTGSPTEEGIYADARATLAVYARELRGAGRPLLYWGRSLGGVVAAYAASREPPDALILESTFPDKAAVVRGQPVLRLLSLFSRYRLDTVGFLQGVRVPVLVVHGDADRIIPFALGQELYERLDGAKQFVRLPGGDHNDLRHPQDEDYWQPIRAFVERAAAASER